MVDSRSIGQQQAQHQHEERSQALRALLMVPLMTPAHAEFAAVRRHADDLRAWFARETGWALHIERDCARLYKRPANLLDASRGLPSYDRRRYVLLCLAQSRSICSAQPVSRANQARRSSAWRRTAANSAWAVVINGVISKARKAWLRSSY